MKIISPWFLILLAAGLARTAAAQDPDDYPSLPRARYRSGHDVLQAFAPISARARPSIVEVNVDENTVALGAVVDTNGLVLTKASEIKAGKLTCWLASGKEVKAQLLEVDEEDDVALVRIHAEGLQPIQWAGNPTAEGQWAITPCLDAAPLAVGIISTLPHRILRPQSAFMGVTFDWDVSLPTVLYLEPGFGAEKAGLKPGDVILAVDGTSVFTRGQVVEILEEFGDGQKVRVHYRRAEEELTADVVLTTPKAGQRGSGNYANERETRLTGDVSLRSEGFQQAIEHDTVLEPWQCGGPLLNLDGKAIGLNIARASRFATYALPASLAQHILAKLKAETEKP